MLVGLAVRLPMPLAAKIGPARQTYPGSHCVQFEEPPVSEYLPAGQAGQSSDMETRAASIGEYVPAGQYLYASEPGGQYEP